MESSEFSPIFSKFNNLRNLYKGCYSSDRTPHFIKIREFFICNTDSSNQPGRHWICFIRVSKAKVEVFNSLGTDDEALELYRNIAMKLNFISEVHFNVTQVQASSTATCGRFCVYFLFKRIFNFDLSFDDLLNDIFTDKLQENEKKISTFFDGLEEENKMLTH